MAGAKRAAKKQPAKTQASIVEIPSDSGSAQPKNLKSSSAPATSRGWTMAEETFRAALAMAQDGLDGEMLAAQIANEQDTEE
ncbi:hypothetical protein FRC09_007694 [Ceratobasidium sp. 395]|nr:hypothetical protein FRC09_007694 [Ceratobasidium sp. 395]